jgi:hypothetical protein
MYVYEYYILLADGKLAAVPGGLHRCFLQPIYQNLAPP